MGNLVFRRISDRYNKINLDFKTIMFCMSIMLGCFALQTEDSIAQQNISGAGGVINNSQTGLNNTNYSAPVIMPQGTGGNVDAVFFENRSNEQHVSTKGAKETRNRADLSISHIKIKDQEVYISAPNVVRQVAEYKDDYLELSINDLMDMSIEVSSLY